jgi:hypothetical protein
MHHSNYDNSDCGINYTQTKGSLLGPRPPPCQFRSSEPRLRARQPAPYVRTYVHLSGELN